MSEANRVEVSGSDQIGVKSARPMVGSLKADVGRKPLTLSQFGQEPSQTPPVKGEEGSL